MGLIRKVLLAVLLLFGLGISLAESVAIEKDETVLLVSHFEDSKNARADYACGSAHASGAFFNLGVEGKYGQGLEIPPNNEAKLTYASAGNFPKEEGTIELWFKPNWNGTDASNNYFFDTSANGLWIQHSGNRISFRTFGSIASIDVSHIKKGEWHHLVATWDKNKMSIYLDGEKGKDASGPGDFPVLPRLTIGNYGHGGYPFNGIIDELKISRKLTPGVDKSKFTSIHVQEQISKAEAIGKMLSSLKPYFDKDTELVNEWNRVVNKCRELLSPVISGLHQREKETMTGEPAKLKNIFADLPNLIRKRKEKVSQLGTYAGNFLLKKLHPQIGKAMAELDSLQPSPEFFSGREAIFYRDIALTYDEQMRVIARALSEEKIDLDRVEEELRKALSYGISALDWADKSLAWAKKKTAPANLSRYYVGDEKVIPGKSGEYVIPVRSQICLNGQWHFSTAGSPDNPPTDWQLSPVPHEPRRYGKNDHDAWYKVEFYLPDNWRQRKIKLAFGSVFHYAEFFLNGRYCGNHTGSYSSFEVDVTKYAVPGVKNNLLVYVWDNTKTDLGPPQDPFDKKLGGGPNSYPAGTIGMRGVGGILQDVYLKMYPYVYVKDVFIITSLKDKTIKAKIRIKNEDVQKHSFSITGTVRNKKGTLFSFPPVNLSLEPGQEDLVEMTREWKNPEPWGIGGVYGSPTLYFLSTGLTEAGKLIDEKFTRFGFREFRVKGNKFLLNNKEIVLQGGHLMPFFGQYNRGFLTQYFQVEREAKLNYERLHQCGSVPETFYDVGDELGVLLEPETMFWNRLGRPPQRAVDKVYDWDDPVWVRNWESYLTDWTKRHWNHPSVVIRSPENESLGPETKGSPLLERFVNFGKLIKHIDPTRPLDYHSYISLEDNRFDTANFHYPHQGNNKRLNEWVKRHGKEKPLVIGEYSNLPLVDPGKGVFSDDRKTAVEATGELARFYAETISYYQRKGAAAIMPFFPLRDFLLSNAAEEMRGPWNRLRGEVPIPWPSLSGPDPKPEMLRVGWHYSTINWFDPRLPVATPTPVYFAAKNAFRAMPSLEGTRTPELVVDIGNDPALRGISVFIEPLAGQSCNPFGVMADREGKAWFVLKEPGKYRIYYRQGGVTKDKEVELKTMPLTATPGYAYIVRVKL